MIDPKVSQAAAAGRIPDNVDLEFLSQSKDRPAIIGIIFVTVFTFLIVGARCAVRLTIVKRFGPDDWLAVISTVLLIAFVVMCMILIDIGSGRHYAYIQHVMSLEDVEYSEVLDFAAHIVYTVALLICRLSGLAFYYELCSAHGKFAKSIIAMAALLVVAFLPQIFLIIFHCLPVTAQWPYDWQPGAEEYKCLPWGIVYSVNSGVSLFCDFLLFGIPVAMIWKLNVPRKRKHELALVLLPGVLVIGISIARLALVIEGQWLPDQSWSYNPMLGVETAEIGSTLIALSVPGLKPLVDRLLGRAEGQRVTTDDAPSRARGRAVSLASSDSTKENGTAMQHLDGQAAAKLTSADNGSRMTVMTIAQGRRSGSSDGVLLPVD